MRDPCPVCGARLGEECLEASEYLPGSRGRNGEWIPGERREVPVYLPRRPHLKRLES